MRSPIVYLQSMRLDLSDPGFDYSVHSEFRARLLMGQTEQRLLETLCARLQERKPLKRRGRQRADSTHVLVAIHV